MRPLVTSAKRRSSLGKTFPDLTWNSSCWIMEIYQGKPATIPGLLLTGIKPDPGFCVSGRTDHHSSTFFRKLLSIFCSFRNWKLFCFSEHLIATGLENRLENHLENLVPFNFNSRASAGRPRLPSSSSKDSWPRNLVPPLKCKMLFYSILIKEGIKLFLLDF